MSHFEKTVDSTILYEGKILTLKRDTVLLENGNQTYREVVVHHGGVAVLALDAQERVLFVSQFRYPFDAVLLELPAGKLEQGESPLDCGIRELREECGYTAETFLPLGQLYPTCAYDTEIIHLFFAKDLHFVEQHLDEDEFLTVKRIALDQAIEMVLEGNIPDAKTQLALLKLKALRDSHRL